MRAAFSAMRHQTCPVLRGRTVRVQPHRPRLRLLCLTKKYALIFKKENVIMQNEKKYMLVPFEPWHFFQMELRPEDAADLAGINMDEVVYGWKDGVTLLYQDEPAFICGAVNDAGVITLWALSSPVIEQLPLYLVKEARALIGRLFAAGAHRIEVYCHKDNRRSFDWLRRSLGFTKTC